MSNKKKPYKNMFNISSNNIFLNYFKNYIFNKVIFSIPRKMMLLDNIYMLELVFTIVFPNTF